jgi:hypothetical protein
MSNICGTSKAPAGWSCTRIEGHEGPCAAVSTLEGSFDEVVDIIGQWNIERIIRLRELLIKQTTIPRAPVPSSADRPLVVTAPDIKEE